MPRKKNIETVTEAVATAEIAAPFAGKEYDVEAVKAAVKADYKDKVSGKVKLLDIYIKPEDGMAYYVVNEITGKVQL